MTDKIYTLLNLLIPAAFGGAASVAAIKAWSNRPENLARAKKIGVEADGPVIAAYQNIIEGYKDQLKETEARWEKRFNDQAKDFEGKIIAQASEFKQQVINLQEELDSCRRK